MTRQPARRTVMGLQVAPYEDPMQEAFADITKWISPIEWSEVYDLMVASARRRMFGLPINCGDISSACRAVVDALAVSGAEQAVREFDSSLGRLGDLGCDPWDHPLLDEVHAHEPRALLVPDDLAEEFLAIVAPIMRGPDDEFVAASEYRDLLDLPGRCHAPVEKWTQANNEPDNLPPVTLLAWPNVYYRMTWFEQHAWLWFAPVAQVRVPTELPRALGPVLWRHSTREPSPWARSMNSKVRSQAATVTRARESSANTPEPSDAWAWRSTAHGHSVDPADALVYLPKGGRQRIHSRALYLWDDDSKRLIPAARLGVGTVIDEPVDLVHFDRKHPLDVAKSLAETVNPVASSVATYREAAGRAADDASSKTSRRVLQEIANGRRTRLRNLTAQTALYNDLARQADFVRTFPSFRRWQMILRRWHGSQSQAGRDGVRQTAGAIAELGLDSPALLELVGVLHARSVEIVAPSGQHTQENGGTHG